MKYLKHLKNKRLSFAGLILAIVALVIYLFIRMTTDLTSTLRSQGYYVESIKVTFQNHKSQKITADKGNQHLIIHAVHEVKSEESDAILTELSSAIEDAQQNTIITDPYTGNQHGLSVPEALRPVKKNTTINGTDLPYYLIHTNEVFSLKIFSTAEAKYKGLFTVYYCPKKQTVYRLEILNGISDFNESSDLAILSNLYCK